MPTPAEKPMPIANDHHGSETGKPRELVDGEADAAAEDDAEDAADRASGTTASSRNCQRISRRRAPSALRTPISRVRSVTADRHDAITPMPPTISAIDEMTTSARNVALADLVPDCEDRVLGDQVEVVGLVELQAVADAHHLLRLRAVAGSRIRPRGTAAIMTLRDLACVARSG